jgi:hypothetical protein
MYKPNIKKMNDRNKELPPVPPIFEQDKLIAKINSKLIEEKAGPNIVQLVEIKNPRRMWISFEYYLDIKYKIGATEYKLHNSNYTDDHNAPYPFEKQLYDKLAIVQLQANQGLSNES